MAGAVTPKAVRAFSSVDTEFKRGVIFDINPAIFFVSMYVYSRCSIKPFFPPVFSFKFFVLPHALFTFCYSRRDNDDTSMISRSVGGDIEWNG